MKFGFIVIFSRRISCQIKRYSNILQLRYRRRIEHPTIFKGEKNMQTIYADGVANITLIDGVIRLDLVNITQIENEKANIRPVGALALSLPALLRTHEQLTQAINKMVEDGILKKNDAQQAVTDGIHS